MDGTSSYTEYAKQNHDNSVEENMVGGLQRQQRGENMNKGQKNGPWSSWRVIQVFSWLLTLLKIEVSSGTFGRIPMTLSSELREEFSSQRCLDSRVNDLILMRDYMIQWLRVQALEFGCFVLGPPHLPGLLDKLVNLYLCWLPHF